MNTIYAKDFGVQPGKLNILNMQNLLNFLQGDDLEKQVLFEKGDYVVDAVALPTEEVHITNTAGVKEFSKGEKAFQNRAPLWFKNVKNTVVDLNGARFVANGKASNMIIQNCENLTVRGGVFTASEPDMHCLRVIKVHRFSVDFSTRSNFYTVGTYVHVRGKDYDYNLIKKYRTAWHIAKIGAKTPNTVVRTHELFSTAISAKVLEKGVIRITYPNTAKFHVGDRFYAFDNRREYVGIFVDRSKNVTVDNLEQNFNYSLAYVAQDSENLKITNCRFAPEKKSGRLMASVADFVQICMCKGHVLIENNLFEGAGDDCLNAHGIHFKIGKIINNTVTVHFKHAQTHGFNPISAGDEIVFVRPVNLLPTGSARVIKSTLLDDNNIELELSTTKGANADFVIEDVTKIPSVTFRNNTVNRIITRGVLVTVRNKVLIENNRFISNSMSGILLSDDAKSWFESGPCRDVIIKGNVFDYCGKTPILIWPENSVADDTIHRNIKIVGNKFNDYKGEVMRLKCAENVLIEGNKFAKSENIKQKDCKNVIIKQ